MMNYLLTGQKLALLLITGCTLLPPDASSQESGNMEHLLVTGTYAPLPVSRLTSSVTLLGFDEIQALNKRTVADVLKTIPGISVEEQGGPGGLTAVYIRGGEANFTLVLIDGVAMNDPTNTRGGGFDFSNLNLAGVERIEVIRGPQSAMHGSDALAGVINIITRRGRQGHQQIARVEHDENYTSPVIYPFLAVPPNGAVTRFERQQTQWVNSVAAGKDSIISAGADYRREQGTSVGYPDLGFARLPTDFELDRKTMALFGDTHTKVTPRLLLEASIRYDNPDDFSGETSFNLGAGFDLTPVFRIKANWGEGFKLPCFFALGHPLLGNSELQPETAQSWDMNLEWMVDESLSLTVAYFSNRYDNLIDFDPVLFRLVNREQVKTGGTELQFSWSPLADLDISVHSTYTDIDSTSI